MDTHTWYTGDGVLRPDTADLTHSGGLVLFHHVLTLTSV